MGPHFYNEEVNTLIQLSQLLKPHGNKIHWYAFSTLVLEKRYGLRIMKLFKVWSSSTICLHTILVQNYATDILIILQRKVCRRYRWGNKGMYIHRRNRTYYKKIVQVCLKQPLHEVLQEIHLVHHHTKAANDHYQSTNSSHD